MGAVLNFENLLGKSLHYILAFQTLMTVLAPPVRMEVPALMVSTGTPVTAAAQATLDPCARPVSIIATYTFHVPFSS